MPTLVGSHVAYLSSPKTEAGGFVAVVEGGLPNIEVPVPPPTNTVLKSVQSKYEFISKIRERNNASKQKPARTDRQTRNRWSSSPFHHHQTNFHPQPGWKAVILPVVVVAAAAAAVAEGSQTRSSPNQGLCGCKLQNHGRQKVFESRFEFQGEMSLLVRGQQNRRSRRAPPVLTQTPDLTMASILILQWLWDYCSCTKR